MMTWRSSRADGGIAQTVGSGLDENKEPLELERLGEHDLDLGAGLLAEGEHTFAYGTLT